VSASEPRGRATAIAATKFLHRLFRLVQGSWSVFRRSRLGISGLSIVLAFAFIGILAPLISPYPTTFEAPESDRFVVHSYRHDVAPNLTYLPPIAGPTTPLSSDRQGGMWIINSAREGFILMDFVRETLEQNETPFDLGNMSYEFDITQDFDYGTEPNAAPPLTAAYYMVPGQNSSLQPGPSAQTGIIAFFARRDFVVADPFTQSIVYRETLSFDPLWTGQDPASEGDMLLRPQERVFSIGVFTRDVGPYRYFYAANPTAAVVFEVVYVHAEDPSPRGGRIVLQRNVSLSAAPFVYYNQDMVTSTDEYRSGLGQGIFLPLANGTLEVYNVTGLLRGSIPLTLGGEPATVGGSIGHSRTSFPALLYLPLRSASYTGIGIFDVATLRVAGEFRVPEPSWEPVGVATSYRGAATFAALYDPSANESHVYRLNATGSASPQFQGEFPGRIQTFFEVFERSKVFVHTESGDIRMMSTTFGSGAVVPEAFPIRPTPATEHVRYAGALGGTLYGSGLVPAELYGLWTNAPAGETTLFQLLGTIRTPLPPGTYPSGNHYILGTDFRGGDILTQLFWGTQVAFIVGILAALVTVGIGTLIGLVAGYYGKLVDTLLMRTTDIFLVLPFLPLVIILGYILRPSIWVIILVIGIVGWPGVARVIRAQVLTLKERPFIDAARVSGASDTRLVFTHIAPNVLPFSFLYMSLFVAGAIITEAALSFLGLGDASVISWGGMLSSVLTFGGALSAWWWLLPPGLTITLLSLGFYLLGRGFDEVINPRLRRR
jgi:peptide/nickel transport system permease protein